MQKKGKKEYLMTKDGTGRQFHDPNDSGLWKLVISISRREMSVVMKHIEDPGVKPQLMFRIPLEGDDAAILSQIEKAVYDYPKIMEDYATEIILTTGKAVWVPTDYMDDEEVEAGYLQEIYRCEPEDIHSNSNEEEGCVYTFIPGLLPFLNRTLPGCRIYSHIFILNRELQAKESEAPRVYVAIRENEADILAYRNGELLSASTHPWTAIADIAYYIFLMADAYSIAPDNLEVFLSGKPEPKKELQTLMKEIIPYVYLLKEPKTYGELDIPLAMAYSLER